MYSSHGYPYNFNQSQHHTPPQAMSMPTPSIPQNPPRLSYPHPSPSNYPTPLSASPSTPAMGGAAAASRGPREFPLLEHLSVADLQKLLESDEKLNAIIHDASQNKQRQVDKEMAMAENRSLADFNLSRETRLREGRVQLARLHEQAKREREIYDMDRRRLESLNENFSVDATRVMLETAATKTEEDSEEIAEEFLNGNIPLTDFLERFSNLRMLAHIRRIKSDKMQELLRASAAATTPTPSHNMASSMAMPHAPSPTRPAPALPPRTGSYGNTHQPGYFPQGAGVGAAQSSGWTSYGGAGQMPTLPAYPQ
ncbi:vacuolar protein sorting-associated protein 37C-like [Diadema antillarum]|uniref:vacuolar protein sorting-associated protein 37C-like n=1 Tax=Diadema antillarum TaxID=105358 RepID=UPI003A885A5A